jgi:hypothetical protein
MKSTWILCQLGAVALSHDLTCGAGSLATPMHTSAHTHTSPPLHPRPHAPLTPTVLQNVQKIHLFPGQKVRQNTAATLTAKVIGTDGRPAPAGITITFAVGADVATATANLRTPTASPAPVTAQTQANGQATASITMPTVGKFVAVASGPNGAAVVVSGPVHIKVRA